MKDKVKLILTACVVYLVISFAGYVILDTLAQSDFGQKLTKAVNAVLDRTIEGK